MVTFVIDYLSLLILKIQKKCTFSFLTLTTTIKTICYDNNNKNKQVLMKLLCPNDKVL